MPESQSHYKYVEGNLTLKWAQSHKHKQTNTHTHAQHQSHLIGLKTPSLHAVPPEGQYAVLETNCKEIKTKRLKKMNTELSLGSWP